MAAKPEQLGGCNYKSPEYTRYIKKVSSKYYRRLGKLLLDEAPKQKRYRGYAD